MGVMRGNSHMLSVERKLILGEKKKQKKTIEMCKMLKAMCYFLNQTILF